MDDIASVSEGNYPVLESAGKGMFKATAFYTDTEGVTEVSGFSPEDVLRDLLDLATARCPHCGKTLD